MQCTKRSFYAKQVDSTHTNLIKQNIWKFEILCLGGWVLSLLLGRVSSVRVESGWVRSGRIFDFHFHLWKESPKWNSSLLDISLCALWLVRFSGPMFHLTRKKLKFSTGSEVFTAEWEPSAFCSGGSRIFLKGAPTPKVGVLTYYFVNFLPKTAWKRKN